MKKQTILTILLLMISSNVAFATNSYTILTDKYGNYAGAVRRVPNSNTYNETDKNGNRLNKNDFEYKITGEGKVNIEQGKLTSSISLTNTKKKAATDGSDKSDKSDTSKKTSTKKTGDDTPIAFYIVIFVAALAVLVLMTRSRSLKGRNKHE